MVARQERRRDKRAWPWLGISMLVIVGLLVVWAISSSPLPGRVPGFNNTTIDPGASSSKNVMPTQPSTKGYEYRLMEERYNSLQPDGRLEVQHRRRESWTAPDGWAWARQTGIDPAQLVLAPSTDWKVIRRVDPTGADVNRALRKMVGTASASELSQIEFNYVSDMLGTETLPASCLPIDYRRATVAALGLNPGVTVKHHVVDPIGRSDATQLTLTSAHSTISLFLDKDLQFLAYTGKGDNGESAFKTIRDQHHVDRIPHDLLIKLGTERVAKIIRE